MPTNTYTIVMEPEATGGYSVVCLEIPGAVSQGKDLAEARAMIAEAIKDLAAYRREQERKRLAEVPGTWEERIQVDE